METVTLTFDFTNLQSTLSSFVDELINTYKNLLIRDNKKASGNLISSLKPVQIEFSNNKMQGSIEIASYWKYVEYGRRPGKFPPMNKILDWIKIKPVIPRPMNGLKAPSEKQLAFLISRKIARDGIQPGNQLKEALDLTWAKYEKQISDAISKDLNEAIDLVTFS